MEQTIILNSGQKIEVYMPDKIELDIDCHLAYIKSGQAEIQNYVDKVSKPEIDTYVTANSEPLVREIVIQKTQPLIEKYVNTDVLPALVQYVAQGETLLNQTTTVADTAMQAQNAALESATEASLAATSAATAADKAEIFVQTLGEAIASKAEDSAVVHLTGDETIGGVKTFTDNITAPNVADTELANLTNTAKESIVSWGMPDYTAGVSVAVGATVTATVDSVYMGNCSVSGSKADLTVNLYDENGVQISEVGNRYISSSGTAAFASASIPVPKGYAVKLAAADNLKYSALYPLKGVSNA